MSAVARSPASAPVSRGKPRDQEDRRAETRAELAVLGAVVELADVLVDLAQQDAGLQHPGLLVFEDEVGADHVAERLAGDPSRGLVRRPQLRAQQPAAALVDRLEHELPEPPARRQHRVVGDEIVRVRARWGDRGSGQMAVDLAADRLEDVAQLCLLVGALLQDDRAHDLLDVGVGEVDADREAVLEAREHRVRLKRGLASRDEEQRSSRTGSSRPRRSADTARITVGSSLMNCCSSSRTMSVHGSWPGFVDAVARMSPTVASSSSSEMSDTCGYCSSSSRRACSSSEANPGIASSSASPT